LTKWAFYRWHLSFQFTLWQYCKQKLSLMTSGTLGAWNVCTRTGPTCNPWWEMIVSYTYFLACDEKPIWYLLTHRPLVESSSSSSLIIINKSGWWCGRMSRNYTKTNIILNSWWFTGNRSHYLRIKEHHKHTNTLALPIDNMFGILTF